MTVSLVQLFTAVAEFMRVFGLLSLVIIEGWVIYRLYLSRDVLYDRLIKAQEDERSRLNQMTVRVVEALSRSTTVAERIEHRRYGALLDSCPAFEHAEDENEDEEGS